MDVLYGTGHVLKLEKREYNNGRYDFYFSYDGQMLNQPIGNGYNNTAYLNNDVIVQIQNYYGFALFLNEYYN